MDEETSLQMDEEELNKLNEVIVGEVTVMEEVMEKVTVNGISRDSNRISCDSTESHQISLVIPFESYEISLESHVILVESQEILLESHVIVLESYVILLFSQ
ncbi:hypothetical protein Tco_1513816, partial [Tanacetum coccineum]